MINIFALVAVLLGIIAIACYYAMLSTSDRNKQLRARVNELWRANIANESHLNAASELWQYCRELEQRNAYLEAREDHCQNMLAGSMLQMPAMLSTWEVMRIGERNEAP